MKTLRAFAASLLLVLASWAGAETLPQIELAIGKFQIRAEVAATQNAREQGLMHREALPENEGMLFVFPDSGTYSLWMANTTIPLSAAFIDRSGVILDIVTMTPQESVIHTSPEGTHYALEMNAGWFQKRGIKPGTQVHGLAKAAP
jgi:uncharacterized membrane protein (UPF0127 family)